MQVCDVLISNYKSTLLEGKEDPINKRQALIEYEVPHWTESGITPIKRSGCCSLIKTNYTTNQ